ncbi:ClpA/ClpB-like protein [Geodermatophilus tzadiensis]|uniref:ClpA/ClpB-like protein n=1 Tax=Geodermatophilus tzadiensis TaxID=1137988 RepID=A0A2T0TQP4_9ACTN|nr:P-loop NTPase fold protein [Geodermatophilus tzadiensis]PRY47838.1 ClpA/ClpB-like protein [Geodermatophilus tzadiensis]
MTETPTSRDLPAGPARGTRNVGFPSEPYVFVSVAQEGARRAEPLLETLREEGIAALQLEEALRPGDDWEAVHTKLLKGASAVLVIWTEGVRQSEWLLREADRAAAARTLVPVTLDGFRAVPRSFMTYQTVDLSGWDGSRDDPVLRRLLGELRQRLHRASPRPAAGRDELPAAQDRLAPSPPVALSPSSQAALAYADGLRRVLNQREVHMEHLIEGLYQKEDGPTRRLLERHGIDRDRLREIIAKAVEVSLPEDVQPTELTGLPPMSRHTAQAVERAFDLAREGVDGWVRTRHLLAGALSVEGCAVVRAMRQHGVVDAVVDAGADAGRNAELAGGHTAGGQQRQHVRFVADEPVGMAADQLGRAKVAEALWDQLATLETEFPGRSFLVHVDGAWGAGKSTLLRFLAELAADPRAHSSRPESSAVRNPWLVATYDAWRQSRVGPSWLTLLQAVRSEVRRSQTSRWRRFVFSMRERARLVSAWQWVALALVTAATATLVWLVAATAAGGVTLSRWGDVGRLAGGMVPLAAAVWALSSLGARFLSLDSRRSAQAFLDNRADPMENLADHFRWVFGRARRSLLLLVDDLDRCPDTFVVELLDVVQKLMREPHPTRHGSPAEPDTAPSLFVVVAADGRWIRKAYDNAYTSLDDAVSRPGATVGSLFLQKIFQVSVPVPRLPDELGRPYFSGLLDGRPLPDRPLGDGPTRAELSARITNAPPDQALAEYARMSPDDRLQVADVAVDKIVLGPDAQAATEHALARFAPLLDPTPRVMKRFLMAYSMMRAVRTAEGSAVGVGPLALWTILEARWPLLAEHLKVDPDSVRLFHRPSEEIHRSLPTAVAALVEHPPDALRAVMNHEAGPLDSETIRAACGQVVERSAASRAR